MTTTRKKWRDVKEGDWVMVPQYVTDKPYQMRGTWFFGYRLDEKTSRHVEIDPDSEVEVVEGD